MSLQNASSYADPPQLTIFHFDVNDGDSTLIVSPDGHGILIDAGEKGRGLVPIKEFLDRAKELGFLKSLDYTIATHYDPDHIGGMGELFRNGWYPEIAAYDRGNSNLRRFERTELQNCSDIDIDKVEKMAEWGSAPHKFCENPVSCEMAEYFAEAERGNKRKTLKPGDSIELDHGLRLLTLVANAKDIDGDEVEVFFEGRKKDCAENDLSIGVLIYYGDFRYLIAGDLTGDKSRRVADVEELILDDAQDIDVYHVNRHGSKSSSSIRFMQATKPTVAIVSNGGTYGRPRKEVINERILAINPKPTVYLTNLNSSPEAWKEDLNSIADLDLRDFDGIIEISVWEKSYRVTRWRSGTRIDNPGKRFLIKLGG